MESQERSSDVFSPVVHEGIGLPACASQLNPRTGGLLTQRYLKPTLLVRFRRVYARVHGVIQSRGMHACGKGLVVGKGAQLNGRQMMVMGSGISIGRDARVEAVGATDEATLHLGDRVRIGPFAHLGAAFSLRIGSGVGISSGALIIDHDHDFRDPERGYIRTGFLDAAPVEIADGAWIGERAIVLKGVRVGRGAVIGAGAVVTRDVPDYSIAVGVPARVVRRFDFDRQTWVKA